MARPASFTQRDVERLEAEGLTRKEIAAKLKVNYNYLITRLGEWEKTKKYLNHKDFYPGGMTLPEELYDDQLSKRLRAISEFLQGSEPPALLLQRALKWLDELYSKQLELFIDRSDPNAPKWSTKPADPLEWWIGEIYQRALAALKSQA